MTRTEATRANDLWAEAFALMGEHAACRAGATGRERLIIEIGRGSVRRPADWCGFKWRDYEGGQLRLVLQACDFHALHCRGVMELAWPGCEDDEIETYSGHETTEMVAKYAGIARQQMRTETAAEKQGNRYGSKKRTCYGD